MRGQKCVISAFGPVEDEPRRIRQPYDLPDPRRHPRSGRESTEQRHARMHLDGLAAMYEPLIGIEPGDHDRYVLAWPAGWDVARAGTIASPLHPNRATSPPRPIWVCQGCGYGIEPEDSSQTDERLTCADCGGWLEDGQLVDGPDERAEP